MTPINPIELEKSIELAEFRLKDSVNPMDDLDRAMLKIISAAKERLQQLKGGDVNMPESNYPPLTSPEPVIATGRGEVIETPRTDYYLNSKVHTGYHSVATFARQLERELITAEKERDELKEQLIQSRAESKRWQNMYEAHM